MTQDDVIRMAEEAGWTGIYSQWVSQTEREHLPVPVTMEQIKAFAKLATAHEREACAQIADEWSVGYPHPSTIIATAIRARKQAS